MSIMKKPVLIIIFIFSSIYFISNMLVKFIKSLTFKRLNGFIEKVEKIASGNNGKIRMEISGNDEISSLGTGINQMIDSLEKTEKAMRTSDKNFRRIIENMQDAYFKTDMNDRVIMISPSFLKLFGYRSQSDVEGQPFEKFFVDPREKKYFDDIMYSNKTVTDHVFGSKRADNSNIDVSVSASYYYDDSGNISGMEGALRDITVRMRSEEELRQAKIEAEEANVAKSDFLAGMSHEIRTPINSIMGFSEMLSNSGLNDKQKTLLNFIKTSSGSLLSLVNNILDFSKIEAGKIELEQIEFSVKEIVREVIDINTAAASKKSLELSYDIDEKITSSVIGDPHKLKQILLNLVTNAVKFTEKGSVKVEAKVNAENTDHLFVEFFVTDTGIGISKKMKSKIFKPFVQADSTITRKYGGTGLGLAISNRLVKFIGEGRIFLKSEPGEGSVFSFLINFKKGASLSQFKKQEAITQKKEKNEKKYGPYKVMLVEDTLLNIELIRMFMSERGHEVIVAENGKIAVDLYEPSKLDCILMDIHMPIMNGYEASKILRQIGCLVPIIAMTADVMETTKKECIESGMNLYLAKPININELEETIKITIEKKNIVSVSPDPGIKETEKISQVFDREKFLKNIGGNMAIYNILLKKFISDGKIILSDISTAVNELNCEKIKFHSHKLKGMALTVCAENLAGLLLKMEKMGKEKDIYNIEYTCTGVKSEFVKFVDEISITEKS